VFDDVSRLYPEDHTSNEERLSDSCKMDVVRSLLMNFKTDREKVVLVANSTKVLVVSCCSIVKKYTGCPEKSTPFNWLIPTRVSIKRGSYFFSGHTVYCDTFHLLLFLFSLPQWKDYLRHWLNLNHLRTPFIVIPSYIIFRVFSFLIIKWNFVKTRLICTQKGTLQYNIDILIKLSSKIF